MYKIKLIAIIARAMTTEACTLATTAVIAINTALPVKIDLM
tara:strand:+ start:14835 stop:14957 length:123 start_codon:yes stop_codon:yes gene_type:complete